MVLDFQVTVSAGGEAKGKLEGTASGKESECEEESYIDLTIGEEVNAAVGAREKLKLM